MPGLYWRASASVRAGPLGFHYRVACCHVRWRVTHEVALAIVCNGIPDALAIVCNGIPDEALAIVCNRPSLALCPGRSLWRCFSTPMPGLYWRASASVRAGPLGFHYRVACCHVRWHVTHEVALAIVCNGIPDDSLPLVRQSR